MAVMSATRKEIAVSELDLDCENPRHGVVADQDAALARLIVDQGEKIVRLAVDIHDIGLSPSQLFIVKREDSGRCTVLDGNRRLAALRILDDPTKLPAKYKTQEFTRAVSEASTSPDDVMCVVVQNRDEARLWLDRIHNGQMAGLGNVPWSAAAKYRFNPHPSSRGHAASAIIVLDWLRQRLAAGDPAHALIDEVESRNPTTFGRLTQDPDVRGWIGFEFQPGTVGLNDDESAVVRRLLKIIEKLAGVVTVTQLKKKRDRAEFIAELLQGDTFGPTSPAPPDDSETDVEPSGEEPAASAGDSAGEAERDESGGTRRLLSKWLVVAVVWWWWVLGCGAGRGGAGSGLRRRPGGIVGGQASAQWVPLWWSPRVARRARLTAAARSLSQCRFLSVPM